jgi:hypothetical protein
MFPARLPPNLRTGARAATGRSGGGNIYRNIARNVTRNVARNIGRNIKRSNDIAGQTDHARETGTGVRPQRCLAAVVAVILQALGKIDRSALASAA